MPKSGAVELIGQRSRHAAYYLNPDQTVTAVVGQDMHYEAAPGRWEPVDLTYRPDGSSYVADRKPVASRADGAGVTVVDGVTGRSMQWLTPNAPQANGRMASVDDQGLTWEMENRRHGVELKATVSARLGQQTFGFMYRLGQARDFTVDQFGNMVSPDGITVRRPVIFGANGGRYECGSWQLQAGPRAAFTIDDTQLPPEAFPYVIDPTTTIGVGAGANDGEVYSQLLTGAAWPPPYDHTDLTGSAYDVRRDYYYTTGDRWYNYLGLLRFPTSGVLPAGATVQSAVVRLSVAQTGTDNARNLVLNNYAWNGTSTDYTTSSAPSSVCTRAISALAQNAYNDFTLTSLAAINLAGYTSFRLIVDGGAPTGINMVAVNAFESAYPPLLELTYAVAGNRMRMII